MNTPHRKIPVLAFLAILSAFGASQAGAAGVADKVLTHKVSYADLDLTRPAGVKALYRRIKGAASQVCAPFRGRQIIDAMTLRSCVSASVDRAVKQINEPALTAWHLSQKPESGRDPSLAAKR